MKRHLPARLLACAALAGSASLAAIAIPGGVSGASPLTVTCTTFSGSMTSQTISGCTGSGAIAADAGTPPAHGVSTVSTKTIKWSNNKTTVTKYTYKPGSDKVCAADSGYKIDLLENATGSVTGGTATGLVGGTFKETVCVYKKTVGGTLLIKNHGNVTL